MRLDHINITVSDLDRAVRFYRGLFDLPLMWRGESGGQLAALVGGDACYLALFAGAPRELPMDYRQVGINHFGVVVDDLAAATARVRDLGGSVSRVSSYEPQRGARRAYCLDPDGHEIELVSYSERR